MTLFLNEGLHEDEVSLIHCILDRSHRWHYSNTSRYGKTFVQLCLQYVLGRWVYQARDDKPGLKMRLGPNIHPQPMGIMDMPTSSIIIALIIFLLVSVTFSTRMDLFLSLGTKRRRMLGEVRACAHSWSSALVNTLHGNQVSVGSKLRLVLQQKVGECTALEILLVAAQRHSPRLTLKLAGERQRPFSTSHRPTRSGLQLEPHSSNNCHMTTFLYIPIVFLLHVHVQYQELMSCRRR